MADSLPSTSAHARAAWLEEALSGWTLPVAALALLVAVAIAYLAGLASEVTTASLLVLAVGLGAALFILRTAVDARRDGGSRALAAAAAAATLLAVLLPALRSVRPGEPLFAGDVAAVGEEVPVPGGASGRLRLLVSGKLPERGEPTVGFTLGGGRAPVEGKLERTYGSARVGRGTRVRVAHDHTADFYPVTLDDGARALRLERVGGQLASPLHVAAYRDPLPFPWGPWLAAGIALFLACVAEARLGLRNDLAVPAGMALAFGLLVAFNATPASAVGPAVGGVVLGAISGALAGWMAGALVRRVVPPAPRPAPSR